MTPNDLYDGKPAFPEHHNVYIDPDSGAHWKDTGEFREDTILTERLTDKPNNAPIILTGIVAFALQSHRIERSILTLPMIFTAFGWVIGQGRAVVTSHAVPQRLRQVLNVESGLNDGLAVPVIVVAALLSAVMV